MNWVTFILSLLQALFLGGAMLMGVWAKLAWFSLAGLGLLSIALAVSQTQFGQQRASVRIGCIAVGWMGSLAAVGSLGFNHGSPFLLDSYYAMLAGLVAVSIFLAASLKMAGRLRPEWKQLGMVWSFLGATILSAASYSLNQTETFRIGLVVWIGLLLACRIWFRLSAIGIHTVNTLMLLCISLPVADWLTRPSYHPTTGCRWPGNIIHMRRRERTRMHLVGGGNFMSANGCVCPLRSPSMIRR